MANLLDMIMEGNRRDERRSERKQQLLDQAASEAKLAKGYRTILSELLPDAKPMFETMGLDELEGAQRGLFMADAMRRIKEQEQGNKALEQAIGGMHGGILAETLKQRGPENPRAPTGQDLFGSLADNPAAVRTPVGASLLEMALKQGMGGEQASFFNPQQDPVQLLRQLPGMARVITGPNTSQLTPLPTEPKLIPLTDEEGNLHAYGLAGPRGQIQTIPFRGGNKFKPAMDASTGVEIPGYYVTPDGKTIDARTIMQQYGAGGGQPLFEKPEKDKKERKAQGGYVIGRVYGGLKYLGGNPNEEANWEKAR